MNDAIDILRRFEWNAAMLDGGDEPRVDGDVGGFYKNGNGGGRGGKSARGANKAKGSGKKAKKIGAVLMICLPLIAAVAIFAIPIFVVGALDNALMKAAGILNIKAALTKQETAIAQTMLENGEVASAYAERLASRGIEVGQVTLAGEFVRTNFYIANIEEMDEVAAAGDFVLKKGNGELAIKFQGKVISAADFLAEMETNDQLFADYTAATDTSARFFYGSGVEESLTSIGVSRKNFANWVSTGSSETDRENFNEIVATAMGRAKQLDASTVKDGEGAHGGNETHTTSISAEEIEANINDVAAHTIGDNSTELGAALLNAVTTTANNATNSTAFMLLMESTQRVRAGENGPINEMLNTLYEPSVTTYYDYDTGGVVTQTGSVMENLNFTNMLAGDSKYSMVEANNFSNDSIMLATAGSENDEAGDVSLSTPSATSAKASVGSDLFGQQADAEKLQNASYAMKRAIDTKGIGGTDGAEAILAGAPYVAEAIAGQNLGAQPASGAAVEAYYRETNKLVARAERAERATRSPFDITSPYTFLGKIANNLAIAGMLGRGSSGTLSFAKSAANLASKSVQEIAGSAVAEGEGRALYEIVNDSCVVVKGAYNVAGDYGCNAQKIMSLGYTSYTRENWQNDPDVGPSLDENGDIKQGSQLAEFITLGGDRLATVGVKSADVCERYKDLPGNRGIFDTIVDALTSAIGIYKSCDGVDDYVANGGKYSFADDNPQKETNLKFAAFVLFDKVDSIMRERDGSVARYKEAYYAAHPRDDSATGRLAALSGLSQEEVEIALGYGSYLVALRNYDASSRYVFAGPTKLIGREKLVDDEELVENLYYAWCGKNEYEDTRNRVFVV